MEGSQRFEREASPESEIQRAVAEKIQKNISGLVNQKLDKLVEESVRQEELQSAADQLFDLARSGATEEEIESRLTAISVKIARDALNRG